MLKWKGEDTCKNKKEEIAVHPGFISFIPLLVCLALVMESYFCVFVSR
jgi:hypothetical protein